MDSLLLLLLLAALTIFVGAILGFVAFGRTNVLRREVETLRARLDLIEAGAPARVSAAVAEEAPPASAAALDVEPPVAGPAAASIETQPEAPTEPPPEPEPEPMAPPVAEPVASRKGDLEEAIGTRWAVWVGGLALALGGIFLVRASIEAGLIGPVARVGLGLLFAAVLIGSAEWLRRRALAEPADERTGRAYVPGVLAAAGIVAAFAATFAAYALYGFLGDGAAFVALAAVAFGALALSLLQGPAVAALGIAASTATPLLISSRAPALGALEIYLLAVAAASFAVARIKRWRWLAVIAALETVGWSVVVVPVGFFNGYDGSLPALFAAAAFAMAVAVFVVSIHPRDPGRVERHDRVAVFTLAPFAVPALFHFAAFGGSDASVALIVFVSVAAAMAAYLYPAVRLIAGLAIVVVLCGYAAFDVFSPGLVLDPVTGDWTPPGLAELVTGQGTHRMIGAGVLFGLLFAGLGLLGALGSAARVPMSAMGTAIPLGLLVIAYLRTGGFAVSTAFGGVALALAFHFAAATETLVRRIPRREFGADGATAVHAIAAVAALALTLAVTLERGWLTIALALVVPAVAWVEAARPVRGLRFAAAAAAGVVALRFLWDPAVVGADLGTTPIFNWLLYGYGVPALAFALAAWRFGATRRDGWVALFEALAVVFTTLTAVMLIHHAMNGGNLFAPVSGLAEQSLVVSALLAVSMGMQWLGVRRPGLVLSKGALLLGGIGLGLAGASLIFQHDPLFTGEAIRGGAFDGTLAIGYLLPAALAFVTAVLAGRRREAGTRGYALAAAWLGGLLAAVWVTLAVRAAWHTGDLSVDGIEEGELYAYSAVWLAAGLVVLGLGVVLRARTVRLVSAGVVMAVVVKVFLLDTAGLTGGLRAASFIGLGAVLVLVGLAYQKLLRRPAA